MKKYFLIILICISNLTYADTNEYSSFKEMVIDMKQLMDEFYSFNESKKFKELGIGAGFPMSNQWYADVTAACEKYKNSSYTVKSQAYNHTIDDGNLIYIAFSPCIMKSHAYSFIDSIGREDAYVKELGMLRDKLSLIP